MATELHSLPHAGGTARKPRKAPLYKLGLLAVLGVFALLAARGYDFYRLDLSARIDHPDFALLRPSGHLGYLNGVLGSMLLLFNLAYLPRRMFPRLPLGSMPAWLNAHVVSGMLAYVLLLFHSAFQQRTLLAAVTFYSLTIVVATGLVGRYLKSLTPLPERERMLCNERALNAIVRGLGDELRALRGYLPPTDVGATPSLVQCVVAVPAWCADAAARRRAIAATAREALMRRVSPANPAEGGTRLGFAQMGGRARALPLTDTLSPALIDLLQEANQLAVAEVRSYAATALLRTWRSMHRFLAILMMTTVLVHIATAWTFGYRWIWSQ